MKFPPVTFWSNLRAKEVATALAACQKGQNFMAACVTAESGLTYVALSGEPSTALLDALEGQLSFKGLQPEAKLSGKKRKQLKGDERKRAEAVRNLPGIGGGTYVIVRDAFSLNNRMMDPDRAQVQSRVGTADNPLEFGGNRNCAEPKALQAAGTAGERVNGMTTIWFGSRNNDYPDPANPVPGISTAVPCGFCQTNEERIMRNAF